MLDLNAPWPKAVPKKTEVLGTGGYVFNCCMGASAMSGNRPVGSFIVTENGS